MIVKVNHQNKILNLPIEEYVKGVLPNEIPSNWEFHALMAQTIAIRSYTCYQVLIDKKHKDFDMCSTQCCQVFNPDTRDLRSDAAVDDCQDWIIIYRRNPVMAMYSSCCGGRTKSAFDVFDKSVPYLNSELCTCRDLKKSKRGHGVGMCQYGMQEYALKGWSFEKILKNYYGDRIQLRTIRNL